MDYMDQKAMLLAEVRAKLRAGEELDDHDLEIGRRSLEEVFKRDEELRASGESLAVMSQAIHPTNAKKETPKSFQDTLKEEVLAISNPNEALIKIVTKTLNLSDAEELLNAYMAEYNVTDNEMCFYPNGEMVLPPGIDL